MRLCLRRASLAAPLLLALAAPALAGCGDEGGATTGGNTTPEPFGPLGERADLPVDERIQLDHLAGPVDVIRDSFGRPHIYAANIADAVRVQGYLVARDRTLQLEVLRRLSEGRMAEMLAQADSSLIDTDISFRHIGLHRVAKKQYDSLPDGAVKSALEAFADGVTQAYHKLKAGELRLPDGVFGIATDFFTDWTPADTLAIGRLQTYLLSYDGDGDVATQQFFDLTRATFNAADPDPLDAKRAGFERDLFRFAPATTATSSDGYPTSKLKAHLATKPAARAPRPSSPPTTTPPLSQAALATRAAARGAQTHGYLAALQKVRTLLADEGFGSNNWGISPARSATGHTLIASDPHLNLTAPSIFYPVSIDVKSDTETLAVGGVAFPGIPGIILGHNQHVAWGATVAGYDVSDAYAEQLSPDGKSVKFEGKDLPIEIIPEEIAIQGQDKPLLYEVQMVPHHGPILPTITAEHQVLPPDPAAGVISIKWTGLEATDEIGAVLALLQAKNVNHAYDALQAFGVGAQNWMIGDTSGNLLWTSHALVPVRDPKAFAWNAATYEGTLPCFVLPGDGSAEWKGFLADELVPWAMNPAAGFLATANNDPIGDTLDNDPSNDTLPDGTPMYLASSFDIGFRQARIQDRIATQSSLFTTEDLAAIQADHFSPLGSRLVPRLLAAIDRAEEQRKVPGKHPELAAIVKDAAYEPTRVAGARALLDAWGKEGDFDAASGVDPDTNEPLANDTAEARSAQAALLFNVWLVRVLRRTFGDELEHIGYESFYREAEAKGLLHLLEADPAQLATFDPATGDSAVWDDLGTPEIEAREERLLRALLDAFAWVDGQGAPIEDLRWGAQHTVRFGALIPLFAKLSIPPASDATFPDGYPRPGDSFGVDNSDFSFSTLLTEAPSFAYTHGPSQRFVIDLDPAGPKAWNALPGGAVWDSLSPHFDDEAEKWRRNENHPVPFALDDVIAAKESRTVVAVPPAAEPVAGP